MSRLNPDAIEEFSSEATGASLSPEKDSGVGNPRVEGEEALEATIDPLDELPRQFPGCPSRDILESWKEEFGGLFAFIPDEDELYLMRPIRRIEYRNIVRESRALAGGQAEMQDPGQAEDLFQESVVKGCLLYPQVDHKMLSFSEAGLIPTLFALIMENSKFIAPDKAMSACYKL